MIDKSMLNVIYYLTNRCNFECGYCCNKDIRSSLTYEPSKENITHMIKLLSKYKIGTFLIYGGEPTISNNLYHLIECINEYMNYDEIKIITNVSNRKCLEYIVNNYNTDKFYMYCTIHIEKYNSDILDNILYIKENFKKFKLAILLDKRYKTKLYNFFETWKTYFTKEETFFQMVRGTNNEWLHTMGFSTNEFTDLKFLREFCKIYDLQVHELLDFKKVPLEYYNKKCCNNFIRIGVDGKLTIYQGVCFPDSYSNISLYDINEYDYSFPIVICDKKFHPYIMCEYCTHEE